METIISKVQISLFLVENGTNLKKIARRIKTISLKF